MVAYNTEAWKLSAVEAVAQLKSGLVTPLQLVEASLARVQDTDGALNAVPEELRGYEQAMQEARRMQDSQACAHELPPWYLHGLPVMIKDLTPVAGLKYVQVRWYEQHCYASSCTLAVPVLWHLGIFKGTTPFALLCMGMTVYTGFVDGREA